MYTGGKADFTSQAENNCKKWDNTCWGYSPHVRALEFWHFRHSGLYIPAKHKHISFSHTHKWKEGPGVIALQQRQLLPRLGENPISRNKILHSTFYKWMFGSFHCNNRWNCSRDWGKTQIWLPQENAADRLQKHPPTHPRTPETMQQLQKPNSDRRKKCE